MAEPFSSTNTEPPAVEVVGLGKNYGPVKALDSVNLSIAQGGYTVLLGPSGGGKTTLLRLLGGFIRPTAGKILLHGRDVSGLPPNQRPTTMVFQSYALFPHMNVEKNVGYGLKIQKKTKTDIAASVERILSLVGLEGYNKRMPHELSGGQQQRVQLARSLVLERDILLLDEPLAALDAKLRKDMCIELKRIQEKIGITFVHVTHNQEEAMTIADRIAIIADGKIVEEGSPREIYERPQRKFTAAFVGENNLIEGKVINVNGDGLTMDAGFAELAAITKKQASVGSEIAISIRSELIRILDGNDGQAEGVQKIPATYLEEVYLGLTTMHLVRLPNGVEVAVRRISDDDADFGGTAGQEIIVGWNREDARVHTD